MNFVFWFMEVMHWNLRNHSLSHCKKIFNSCTTFFQKDFQLMCNFLSNKFHWSLVSLNWTFVTSLFHYFNCFKVVNWNQQKICESVSLLQVFTFRNLSDFQCVKYARIRDFSALYFPVKTESSTLFLYLEYGSQKTRILAYFTHCSINKKQIRF